MLLQIRLTPTEFILYGALAGLILGFLLGLIPLFLGIKKHNRKYGVYGFIVSIVVGPISAIISLIVVAIFSWLILRKPKTEVPTSSSETDSNETSDTKSP